MKKELVIAAYDKDLDWIDKLNTDIKVSIYRKGNIKKYNNEILLTPNTGRCVHTFFKHIYTNYDSLSDVTFFAQDYPFDHWEDIVDVINNNTMESRCQIQIGGYYGFHFNTIKIPSEKGGIMWNLQKTKHHGTGNVLMCHSNGYPQDSNTDIDVNTYWKILFDEPFPENVGMYEFIPGGHFCITKKHATIRSKKFYQKIVELLENNNSAPWIIERLECYIFNLNYITKL